MCYLFCFGRCIGRLRSGSSQSTNGRATRETGKVKAEGGGLQGGGEAANGSGIGEMGLFNVAEEKERKKRARKSVVPIQFLKKAACNTYLETASIRGPPCWTSHGA